MSEVLKQKIRRDLSRWSRKLLLCIGLETVGRELVGEENWRHLYPAGRDWERDKSPVSDFDPGHLPHESQDISCPPTLADLSHLDPSASAEEEDDEEQSEEKNDTYENIFHMLPYWYFINRALGASSVRGTGNISGDLSNTNHPLLEALDAQHLNTLLLLHSLKQQQQDFQVQGQGESQETDVPFNHAQNLPSQFQDSGDLASTFGQTLGHGLGFPPINYTHLLHGSTFSNPGLSPSDDLEQPLDLTQKTKVILEKSLDESCQLVTTEVTSSNGRDVNALYSKSSVKSSPRPGRGYTSQELEAALNDIQSGKLGTRRAAVIYGIPRSTLRNKVYKLGKDRSHPYRQKDKLFIESKSIPLTRNLRHNSQRLIDSGPNIGFSKESAFSPVLPKSTTPLTSTVCSGELSDNGAKSEEEISLEKKALKEWLQSKMSRQKLNNVESASNIECVSKVAERQCHPLLRKVSESSDLSDDVNQDFGRKNVLNKIPLPIDSRTHATPKSLKRKLYDEDESPSSKNSQLSTPASTVTSPDMHRTWKTGQVNDDDDCSMDESDMPQVNIKDKVNDYFENGQDVMDQRSVASGFLSDVDANGKKSRPKRGKYRNYDRDALLKAVKAVQNGEMSVHRAGSYFGVPHSTLEYKVKERHLLRRPKRKDSELIPKPTQKSSPESSLSDSEIGTNTRRIESSSVTLSTRETLTRFLNSGQHSSTASPDSPSRTLRQRSNKVPLESGICHEHYLRKNESAGSARSSYMNSYHLNDIIRSKFDNSSLLDLTKKS